MIQTKKILGASLAIMAIGFAFDITAIKDAIMDYSIVSIGILSASAYLLFVSGRRN